MLSSFLSFLFPLSLFYWLIEKKRTLRSLWLQPKFKACDSSVKFGHIGMINCPQHISIGKDSYFADEIYLMAWETYCCTISNNVIYDGTIEKQCEKEIYVQHLNPELTIGRKCRFGAYNHITCTNRILIGDGVLTGKWVTITDNSHGAIDMDTLKIMPILRPVVSKGPVIINKNVWIGDKATILPGVTIGEGSIIAANTVVTQSVPPYSVVAGNPGKIIKKSNKDE